MADSNDLQPTNMRDRFRADRPGTAPELTGLPDDAQPGAPDSQDGAAGMSREDTPAPAANDAGSTGADPKTDAAVDDIMKHDGDDTLQDQDKAAAKADEPRGKWQAVKALWRDWWTSPRKRYGTIGVIVVAIAALAAVPVTRYTIAGLVLKTSVTVRAVDSKTGAPVSGATVKLAGQTAETDAAGRAVLHVHPGNRQLQISKQYYTGVSRSVLLSLSPGTLKASLVALGRQVSVKLVNAVTGKPLPGAEISAQGSKAKAGADGTATLVIASGATTRPVTIALSGYNTAEATVTAGAGLARNTFKLTPAGKIYFLSNLTGTINVIKTNLDGSDRQVVLEGTGNEDPGSTSLLASRGWKYLALLAKRDGDNASVYLIDTTNGDRLTTIDEGDAHFSLIGWSGDRLIYEVNRSATVSDWQSNQVALKSFDPTTGHTLLLDQTQGGGSGANAFFKQQFSEPYLIGNQVVYNKSWVDVGVDNALAGKQGEIDTIGADGSGHKVVKQFAYTPTSNDYYATISVSTQLYAPESFYIAVTNNGENPEFFQYENGTITAEDSAPTDSAGYPTFLLSPSGSSTFWAEQRDGKNTLFTGGSDAKSQKQVASLSDYSPYGWYTDSYLLVSKNSSELYIMPATGGTPIKITDYYKPSVSYQGYGGGYGGL